MSLQEDQLGLSLLTLEQLESEEMLKKISQIAHQSWRCQTHCVMSSPVTVTLNGCTGFIRAVQVDLPLPSLCGKNNHETSSKPTLAQLWWLQSLSVSIHHSSGGLSYFLYFWFEHRSSLRVFHVRCCSLMGMGLTFVYSILEITHRCTVRGYSEDCSVNKNN